MLKQFICMKWGERYGPDYVNKLYGMIRRHTTGDFRLCCLTDQPDGIRPDVDCFDCPIIDIPAPHNNRGWRKVNLFSQTVADLQGQVLYLDLDLVITASLDGFFEHQPEASFVIMDNPTQPGQGIGNTSVYRFEVGAHTHVLERLLDNPEQHIHQYRNSQTFISRTLGQMHTWPKDWCRSFKAECVPPMPARWWKTPVLPEGARVIIFTGKPDPDEAAIGKWPVNQFYKRIYKTLRPTPWITEHWKA